MALERREQNWDITDGDTTYEVSDHDLKDAFAQATDKTWIATFVLRPSAAGAADVQAAAGAASTSSVGAVPVQAELTAAASSSVAAAPSAGRGRRGKAGQGRGRGRRTTDVVPGADAATTAADASAMVAAPESQTASAVAVAVRPASRQALMGLMAGGSYDDMIADFDPGADILAAFEVEVSTWKTKLRNQHGGSRPMKTRGRGYVNAEVEWLAIEDDQFKCPLCPWRAFQALGL